MSGGHFDYRESYLEYIAEQLEHDIKFNGIEYDSSKPSNAPYGFQHSAETVGYLKLMVEELYKLREMLHEYDYAVSGDSSIERFIEKARAVYRRKTGGE